MWGFYYWADANMSVTDSVRYQNAEPEKLQTQQQVKE